MFGSYVRQPQPGFSGHGPNLPPTIKYHCQGRDVVAGGAPDCAGGPRLFGDELALCDGSIDYTGAAGTVQPRPSCRRPWPGLPLLPRVRGDGPTRRNYADGNLHDVPFADLDQCNDAGAGTRQSGKESADTLASGP